MRRGAVRVQSLRLGSAQGWSLKGADPQWSRAALLAWGADPAPPQVRSIPQRRPASSVNRTVFRATPWTSSGIDVLNPNFSGAGSAAPAVEHKLRTAGPVALGRAREATAGGALRRPLSCNAAGAGGDMRGGGRLAAAGPNTRALGQLGRSARSETRIARLL